MNEVHTVLDTAPLRAAAQRQKQNVLQKGGHAKRELDASEMYNLIQSMGIDPVKESEMIWIAEEMLQMQLPPGWTEYVDDRGRPYYHNAHTGVSSWVHPMDDVLQDCVDYFRQVQEDGGFWSIDDNLSEHEEKMRDELAEWQELFDERGNKFFYHKQTEESRQEDPRHAAYHNFYARINMVQKMRERLPHLAVVSRPEDPAVIRQRERLAKEERDREAVAVKMQSVYRVMIARQRAIKMRERRQRNCAMPAQRPVLKVCLTRAVEGSRFKEDLLISVTTARRRELRIIRCQAFFRGCLTRIWTRPMIAHRRKREAKARHIQRVWLAHYQRRMHPVWVAQLAALLRPFPARRRDCRLYEAAVRAYYAEQRRRLVSTIRIQSWARGAAVRRRVATIRRQRRNAIVLIQLCSRSYLRSCEVLQLQTHAAPQIQRFVRGWAVRRTRHIWQPPMYEAWRHRQVEHVRLIQSWFVMRKVQARTAYDADRTEKFDAATAIQCFWRRILAARVLAQLKEEWRYANRCVEEVMADFLPDMELEVQKAVERFLASAKAKAEKEDNDSDDDDHVESLFPKVKVKPKRRARPNVRPPTAEQPARAEEALAVDDREESGSDAEVELDLSPASMALFGLGGGESAGVDFNAANFDRVASLHRLRSVRDELGMGDDEDDGMKSEPASDPDDIPEEIVEDIDVEGADESDGSSSEGSERSQALGEIVAEDDEAPSSPGVLLQHGEEDSLLPTKPKKRTYHGRWRNGKFVRTKVTSLEELSEEAQQEIIDDLQEQRQRKLQELVDRQRKHAAREAKRRQKEAEQMRLEAQKAWKPPKKLPPDLPMAKVLPPRPEPAEPVDERELRLPCGRLFIAEKRRRAHAMEFEALNRSTGSALSMTIPMRIVKMPPLHKAPLAQTQKASPLQRHMHVHTHEHHNTWDRPPSSVGSLGSSVLPILQKHHRSMSEADLTRCDPRGSTMFERAGFNSPPTKMMSWKRLAALHERSAAMPIPGAMH